jgi:hypothetical protein
MPAQKDLEDPELVGMIVHVVGSSQWLFAVCLAATFSIGCTTHAASTDATTPTPANAADGAHDRALAGDVSEWVPSGQSAGVCLIEYNGALVDGSADPCCVRLGGPNTCDLAAQCNPSSGAPCCLFYATDYVIGGEGCCRYSDVEPPLTPSGSDRTVECNALLAYDR